MEKLPELSQVDLAKVDAYERKNENRSTITSRIDSLQGDEPWPGYDELRVDEVRAVLSEGDEQRIKDVRAYERKHKARAGVIQATERELSKDVPSVQANTATPRPSVQKKSSGAKTSDGITRQPTQHEGAETMNPTESAVAEWRGDNAVDSDGEKIGTIEEIYMDAETGKPEWLAVKTGLFGSKLSFIPIAEASETGGGVQVPYDNQQVKDAPAVEPDGELSQEEEANLYRHYGLGYSEARSDSGLPRGNGRDTVGHDTSGPTTDDAMTRSEEELRVGKASRESGRARLRKYVVTEQVQQTVPVQREEVRVEREPITDANVGDATDGPAISEEEHEVILHEEEVVVEKRAVPKERVRLDKDTVIEDQTVSEQVRKEQIEAEGDIPGRE